MPRCVLAFDVATRDVCLVEHLYGGRCAYVYALHINRPGLYHTQYHTRSDAKKNCVVGTSTKKLQRDESIKRKRKRKRTNRQKKGEKGYARKYR